jgi:ketosteroid isomerase-like protein
MNGNAELIKGLYQSFANGDVPAVLERFSPDIEWHEAESLPYGGVYNGPQEVVDNVFMKLATEWDDFKAIPNEYIDGGERIVALGEYSGTFKTSAKNMRAPFAHVWTFNDGIITKFVQFTDTVKFNEAL